jgi:hypothetical protein
MGKYFPDSTPSNGKAACMAALRFELQQEAQEDILLTSSRPSRTPGWPVIVATLAVLGMLLTFHHVVREALQQSELRHKAMALHAEAIGRCNNLPGREVSNICLLQVNAEARKAALPQAQKTPSLQE